MARVLHGMPLNTLPDPGELQDGDQIVAYREDTGKAYRSDIAGLGAAANHNISDEFSVVTKYSVGDYCIYNNTLYKCIADHTGDWNENDFEKVTVSDELGLKADAGDMDTAINEIADQISAMQDSKGAPASGTNVNNMRASNGYYGLYWCTASNLSGTQPYSSGNWYYLIVWGGLQLAFGWNTSNVMRVRMYINSSWTSWTTV